MHFGGVAFVLRETVAGIRGFHLHHDAVAGDLRDHARGGDAVAARIASDQCGVREWKWADRPAIDEHVRRRQRQSERSLPHCLVSRAQNIESIDIGMLNDGDGPADVIASR